MKIAFIVPKISNQGPIIVVKEIIESIISEVDVIDLYYFDDYIELDIACNKIKISMWDRFPFDNYDIIHSHMLRPDFYVWLHKKKSDRAKFISTLHQNIYDNLKGNYNAVIAYFFEKIWLYILKKHDYIVMLTEEMRNNYYSWFGLKSFTIYNGRRLTESNQLDNNVDFIKLNKLKSNFKIIGTHCLLTKRKGVDQLIRCMPLIKEYVLVILGDGQDMFRLKALSNELNVSDRVFFLGYRSNATQYLNFFDVYAMTSYSEGFPLGLLEAGLSKLPVVCSDIPIFRELFDVNDLTFFKLNDIKSLEDAIHFTFSNKKKLSLALFDKIQNKYSVEIMSNSYLNLYKQNLLT
jgi:glycosyltransferase involved in cell wall biosynthesis